MLSRMPASSAHLWDFPLMSIEGEQGIVATKMRPQEGHIWKMNFGDFTQGPWNGTLNPVLED